MTFAAIDDDDPVADLLRLVELVRGQQQGSAIAAETLQHSQMRWRLCGSHRL